MAKSILVVGLERKLFEEIDPLLNRSHLSVDRVARGKSGLALCEEVPFDLITAPTLDKAWTSDRSKASAFFKDGKVREVAGLCTEGVKIVRDLFVTALSDEDIMAQAGPDEAAQAIRLDLRSRVDPQLLRLIRSR